MFNDNAGMYFLVSLPCKFIGNLGVTLLWPNGYVLCGSQTGTWHCVSLFVEPAYIERDRVVTTSVRCTYICACIHRHLSGP